MRGILRRIKLIVKVWLNALLAPAEDPRQAFAVAHRRRLELLEQVRRALTTVDASRTQLARNMAEARGKLPQLQERARQALLAGREDQARFALQLRQVLVEETRELENQVRQLEQEHQALSLVEHRMAGQIEAFFARQDMLLARLSSAEAKVQIKEALTGVSEELAGLDIAIERAEETTENMQARVSAIDELVETGILEMATGRAGGAGAPQLSGGARDQAVEDLLAALRQEMKGR